MDYTDDANTGGPAFNVLDNCDLDPEVTISYNDISVGCTKRYEKVFTVTDDCGNATTRTQIININAGSAADWEDAPQAVINISCLADLPSLVDLNYGGASSACATPATVSGVENRSSFLMEDVVSSSELGHLIQVCVVCRIHLCKPSMSILLCHQFL
ncbi:MAG: hypothetical protein IPN72_14495 [Saprospiraceae bacterium]|nr:hypothetical protein [Saprospiraceae bacterium]